VANGRLVCSSRVLDHNDRVTTVSGGEAAFEEFERAAWARLAGRLRVPFADDVIESVRGLGDPVDLTEVAEVYLPLSRLLSLYVRSNGLLRDATGRFLGARPTTTPFVIGIAGSVAVGKSTTARVLRELLAAWPAHPHVELVTTDGFLHPNAELERRQILQRKGFPESYDRAALLQFVIAVKSGTPVVTAPLYSHVRYDIIPDGRIEVRSPDILIVEGLNVLQPGHASRSGGNALAVSDFFDFSVYVDAATSDVRRWYIDRFLALRETAFSRPDSYFHHYRDLTEQEAVEQAAMLWDTINGPNLVENILPTRGRADLVMGKGSDHTVRAVRLRKL
jgi:type I pantothenate kinase